MHYGDKYVCTKTIKNKLKENILERSFNQYIILLVYLIFYSYTHIIR